MIPSAGKRLKLLMEKGIVILPGAFNGISAKLTEEAGFSALYISGAGLSCGQAALPDTGLLTLTEVINLSSYITSAVNIPCVIDGDTGFGEEANVVRTIREMERISAAGVQLEDQELPKKCGHLPGKKIVPASVMTKKISAASKARKDSDFLIIARTDARETEGLEGAVNRAGIYIEAGADIIFPEALHSREEFATFKKEVSAPLLANMTEFGKSPLISSMEFEELGYQMVIFPLTTMRLMLKSVVTGLNALKTQGTQTSLIQSMFTRNELYSLLDYDGYGDSAASRRKEAEHEPEGNQ